MLLTGGSTSGVLFGVEVVDISDISAPTRAGFYKLGQVRDVAAVNGYLYVADDFDSLVILETPP